MSVLIKDMEMPRNCLECKIKAWEEGFNEYVCPFSGILCLSIGRQDDCPLVALPEKHGDLIDRNTLKKDYRMGNDCERCETDWKSCQYDRVYSKMDFCGLIDDTPVVIEAEGD